MSVRLTGVVERIEGTQVVAVRHAVGVTLSASRRSTDAARLYVSARSGLLGDVVHVRVVDREPPTWLALVRVVNNGHDYPCEVVDSSAKRGEV